MKHLWMDAWPYFPGIKVGNNVSLFFFSDFWVALIVNRNIVRNTTISEHMRLELFSLTVLAVFVVVSFRVY